MLVPALPLQVVHEKDMGQALLRCAVADGPPGAYNIAADGILTPPISPGKLACFPCPSPSG